MAMAASIKEFLLAALREDQRLDGRRPFDIRRLTLKFAREDGAAEVQLGQTRIVCHVSCQLVQPYPDQPNEGILVVHTEFSPMADPTFEAGRPGENAVELGRVIDRGLRESRAIDTESLCVLAGKAVWSLRIDICVLDNGGNLIDAASVAALAALLSFRRPECSIVDAEEQDVVIHPPEVREPLPLIMHYLPIAFTFGFFGDGELLVMDPTYKEELLMKGRLTVILSAHGDICAIQKGGGIGVSSSDILRCLRVASTKVADVTSSLKKAVEAHELERAQRKIKRHLNLSGVKEITLMGDVQARSVMALNSLGSSDVESNSDESFDDSTSEEEKTFTRTKSDRIVKQGTMAQPELQRGRDQLVAQLWEDITEPSSATSSRLHAGRVGEVQCSTVGHGDHKEMTLVSDEVSSVVSQKLESLGFQALGEVGNITSGSSSLKSTPRSLLDAIKWDNVKKKKVGGLQP